MSKLLPPVVAELVEEPARADLTVIGEQDQRPPCGSSRPSRAKADVFFYMESFYNRRRRHSALDYLRAVDCLESNICAIHLQKVDSAFQALSADGSAHPARC
jgi:hypothetical protein